MILGGYNTSLIFDGLIARSDDHPERPALADAARQLTYAELVDEIRRRAAVLRAAGVSPGDRVVVAAANSADQLATHFAVLRAGAVSVPLDGGVSAERLAFIVRDCEARIVCTDERAGRAAREAGAPQSHLAFDDLAARATTTLPVAKAACREADDIACLMYTTGSTGDPKAVTLTHRSLASALSHIIEYLGCRAGDREAVVLPLSHSFGLGHAYCTLLTGGFLWVNDGLRPLKGVLDALLHHNINAMPMTPALLRLLLGAYRVPFLRSAAGLRRMVVNSEPLPPAQAAEVMAALPDVDLIVYYGLTEASRSTFLRLRLEPAGRHGSAGKAAPRVEIAIRDESGAPVEPGLEGEVCIAGPHLAVGYWRRPEEQAAAFRNGWLRTGDLGTLDADGYLTITGRLKDQINVGGVKVTAAEIEAAVRKHPLVADVAVTGVADPSGLRGEVVAAAVVARDASLSVADVAAYCGEHLAAAAQPQSILIVEAIPRAESGKVLKGELRKLFQVGSDRGLP